MFCPTCGSILRPQVIKGKTLVGCSCGYVQKDASGLSLSEKIVEKKQIEVIEKETVHHPIVEAKCAKCGHMKAQHWSKQTRSSDEPETRFFRCEKCKHTWREYD